MSRNARNPSALARAKQRDDRLAERARTDLAWVLSDARGRRVMWRLLADAGMFRSSFTGNSETFFREGSRNVALQLWGRMEEADLSAVLTMQQEAITQRLRDEAENQKEESSDE